MYVVATITENADIKHLCHHRNICWTVLILMLNFLVTLFKVLSFLTFISAVLGSLFSVCNIPAVTQKSLCWETAAVTIQFLGLSHLSVHLGCGTVAYPNVCSTFLRGLGLASVQLSMRDCQRHVRKTCKQGKALGKEGLRGFYQ